MQLGLESLKLVEFRLERPSGGLEGRMLRVERWKRGGLCYLTLRVGEEGGLEGLGEILLFWIRRYGWCGKGGCG